MAPTLEPLVDGAPLKVVGITMVKDELDVIAATLTHMLGQVDELIVADNGSTDGTRELIAEMALQGDPVTLVHDDEVAYYQSRKMSRLAAYAADRGADWVVPFDADELWLPHGDHATVKQALAAQPDSVAVVTAKLLNHVSTNIDLPSPNPFVRMGWRFAELGALDKVACRPQLPVTIAQGNHAATYRQDVAEGLDVHHYPVRTAEQLIRKVRNGAAAYAAADLPEDLGRHWREHGTLTDDELRAAFETWWFFERPHTLVNPALVYDPQLGAAAPNEDRAA